MNCVKCGREIIGCWYDWDGSGQQIHIVCPKEENNMEHFNDIRDTAKELGLFPATQAASDEQCSISLLKMLYELKERRRGDNPNIEWHEPEEPDVRVKSPHQNKVKAERTGVGEYFVPTTLEQMREGIEVTFEDMNKDERLFTCHDCDDQIYTNAVDREVSAWLVRHKGHDYTNHKTNARFGVPKPKDETQTADGRLGGEGENRKSPVLSCLFFVTGDTVFGKVERYVELDADGKLPANIIMPLLQNGAYLWTHNPLDQIRSDVDVWVASLESDKPVPRKERILTDGQVCVDAWQVITQWTSQRINGPVLHDLEEFFGKEIPVYLPTKYTANWTELTRKLTPEDIPGGLPYSATSGVTSKKTIAQGLNALQPTAFEVWRLEIVRGEG